MKSRCLYYKYANFEIVDDIVINRPRGQYSRAQEADAFSTVIDAILANQLDSWFLIEHFEGSYSGPRRPTKYVVDYYNILKCLGCRQIVLISSLPPHTRLSLEQIIEESNLAVNYMPDEKSAIDFVLYLKHLKYGGFPDRILSY